MKSRVIVVVLCMLMVPFYAFADRVDREAARAEKQEIAEQLRKVFSEEDTAPAWLNQAKRGKDRGTIENMCVRIRRFYEKAQGFKTADQKKIRWTDITTTVRKEEAILQHRREGKEAVGELLALLKQPSAERAGIRCAKKLPDLGSSPAILETIVDVLQEAKIDPAKAELSADALRDAAREAFLTEVEAARAAGDTARLKEAARHAAQWDFGPGDLGLTPQEIQAIR